MRWNRIPFWFFDKYSDELTIRPTDVIPKILYSCSFVCNSCYIQIYSTRWETYAELFFVLFKFGLYFSANSRQGIMVISLFKPEHMIISGLLWTGQLAQLISSRNFSLSMVSSPWVVVVVHCKPSRVHIIILYVTGAKLFEIGQ